MIHEAFPYLTETASDSHPCCVVSVIYDRPSYFHGGNTGSNPVGDANRPFRADDKPSAVTEIEFFGISVVAIVASTDDVEEIGASLHVTVDKNTGCIIGHFDKKSNFETLAPGACGNDFEFFKDTPKEYDAWNIDPGTLHQTPARIVKAETVQLLETGPPRAAIRVLRKWQNSAFEQQIVLNGDADELSIINDIDWHETHVLLKAAFPLVATSAKATDEIPFGSIERPSTRNNSWDKAQRQPAEEIKPNYQAPTAELVRRAVKMFCEHRLEEIEAAEVK